MSDGPQVKVCCGGGAPVRERRGGRATPWFRIAVAAVLAGQSMAFSLALNVGEDKPLPGTGTYWLVHGGLLVAALAVVALLGPALFAEQWRALRARRITVEMLFVLSLFGALGGSLISTLTGSGSVYYEVAAIVLVVYSLGKAIGARNRERALAEAAKLREDFSMAWELDAAGGRTRVPVTALQPGSSRVSIAPGEPVPVDGEVLAGEGFVLETALTGEPLPVVRRPGDALLAGTWSVDGTFEVRPVRLAGERRIDAVLQAVERGGQEHPSALQVQADRLMRWFVPSVVLVSTGTFAGWLWALPAGQWAQALFNAMAVLLVACPCALGLATPIAVWGGLVRLSSLGLICQGGRLLDALAGATTILFDKTGTVSDDALTLADFVTVEAEPARRRWLLAAVAAAEADLPHPVARTLAAAAPAEAPRPTVRDRRNVPGQGVVAQVDGHELRIGEAELTGLPPGAFAPLLARSPAAAITVKKLIYIALDGQPSAVALLDETLRGGAADTLRQLSALGLHQLVLTGDPEPRWRSIERVEVRAGLSPAEKEQAVRELRAGGATVVFVGDGINDASAMVAANSSIAMGSGAGLAVSAADAVLQGNNLAALPTAVRIAREVRASVRGNMRFAVCYNAIGMALAAAGVLHPVVAALLMVGSSTVVSTRALRVSAKVR